MTGAKNGVALASYTYDGDGKRVKAQEGGFTTYYIGDYYEWREGPTTTQVKYYYAAGQRIAMRKAGTLTWLLGDHLGSATITATENGTLASEQKYTAWGQTRSGSVGTDRQYTGQISELQLGIYFYNARYYDPYLTRFLSADTIIPQPGNPMAWDRYAYVWLSPINHNDPTGHKPPCEGTDEFGNCSRIRKILILACGDGLGRNCEGDYSSYGNEKPLSHFEKTYRERGYEVVYFGADSYINEDGEIVGPYGEALSEFILSQGEEARFTIIGHSRGASASIWALGLLNQSNVEAINRVTLLDATLTSGTSVTSRLDTQQTINNAITNYHVPIQSYNSWIYRFEGYDLPYDTQTSLYAITHTMLATDESYWYTVQAFLGDLAERLK